jgi:uncharacterized protein (DUF983 family)
MVATGEIPPLTVGRMLARGMTLCCPLCGSRKWFVSWFRMRDRCPRCNFPLDRIEGHQVGAVGMNTVVSFGTLLVAIAVGLVLTYPDPPVAALLAVSIGIALVVPILFFPFSRTLWSAIDLAMRPVEPDDAVDLRWLPPPQRPGATRSRR